MHSVDSLADAAHLWERSYGDTGVPVAGPGAPLVAEFSVAEFAAALGLSTDAGRGYLGEAVELRYRLPRLWARVTGGDLAAWKARRIARATIALTPQAASFVDGHVAHVAHRIGPFQLDRLIEEAIARHMPEEAERRRRAAADGRRFDVETRDPSLAGTAQVWGELDLADALDLDAAVAAGAEQLKALGCDRLPRRAAGGRGRRARPPPADPRPRPHRRHTTARRTPSTQRKARQVVLYAHLSDAAMHRPTPGGAGAVGEHPVADHRRAGPHLVRQPRHHGGGEAGDRPQRPRPRHRSTRSPTGWPRPRCWPT